MFPDEVQAILAKIIFFIFSFTVLCLSKVRAEEINYHGYKGHVVKDILIEKTVD